MKLEQLIDNLLKEQGRVLIAIDGQCGSGKTTLGKKLQEKYDALLIHMDDFFLPPGMKTKERLNQSGGNVHYERIQEEVLENIKKNEFSYRKFDCQVNEHTKPIHVQNKNVIIVEGVYSLHKELREYYDIKILLKIDDETQIKRIKKRSGEKLLKRFVEEWIPLENYYFKSEKIEEIVDITITNS